MRWRVLAAASAFAALFGAACASLVGVEDLPGPGAPADAGGDTVPTYAVAACAGCVASACRELELACRADKSCAEAYRALAACKLDEVDCRYAAEQSLPSSASTQRYLALDACRRTACLSECYGSKGLAFAFGPECLKCVDDGCPAVELACLRSGEDGAGADSGPLDVDADAGASGPIGDCERHVACLQAVVPPNPDNSLACKVRFPSPEYGRVLSCAASANCASCPVGNFQCVGGYRWALPAMTTAHLSITAHDLSGVSVPSTVRACSTSFCADCTKEHSLAEVHVDDVADLTIPISGFGFVGCLQAIPDDLTKYSETSQWQARPMTRDEPITILVAKPGELDFLRFTATGTTTAAPDTSVVTFTNRDCTYTETAGLTTELDGTPAHYLNTSGLVARTATATDGSGSGIFFDVPYGTHELSTKQGTKVVAKGTVTVAKGQVTFVLMYPTPAT